MSRWYLKMQHDLKGEGAVVTGVASKIGEAIATAFIEAALLCDLSAKTRPSHFEALDAISYVLRQRSALSKEVFVLANREVVR